MTTLELTKMYELKDKIELITQQPEKLQDINYQAAVIQVLRYLECGALRVLSPADLQANCGAVPMLSQLDTWIVHAWVKQAILLAFQLRSAQVLTTPLQAAMPLGDQGRIFSNAFTYNDKLDLQNNLHLRSIRSVPGSLVREGAFVSPQVILMPSFVNIGAWIGDNTMIDTWATAGSCAQIGSNVHLAGGVGIGGVLEPASARPVTIGDNAFIGSRAIVVEGVIISSGAVLGANVCLTSSTPIYDVTTDKKTEYRGFVPANAVVAAGTRIKQFPGGEVPLQCAYIIAYRSERTNAKVSLNEILRETGIPV